MSQVTLQLTIAASSQHSTALAPPRLRYARSLTILAPATLDAGTYTVQISHNGTDWVDLQSGGADVVITAGHSVVVTDVAFRHLRIGSSVASQTAQRVFQVTIQEKN